MSDRILIIDFGSQVTQLIARRVRESGVYCEIVPFNKAEAALNTFKPKAVILSGGPASVADIGTPRAPQRLFEMGLPVLGICYGQMTMAAQLGGKVESSDHREFGRAFVEVKEPCALFDGVWQPGSREQVWMSHGDRIIEPPPGFRVVGISEGAPFAAIRRLPVTAPCLGSYLPGFRRSVKPFTFPGRSRPGGPPGEGETFHRISPPADVPCRREERKRG